MNKMITFFAAMSLFSAASVFAHPNGGAVTGGQMGHGQVVQTTAPEIMDYRQSRRAVGEARRNVMQMDDMIMRFDRARVLRDYNTLATLNRNLENYVNTELINTRNAMQRARMETRRSHGELRESRGEMAYDQAVAVSPPGMRQDQWEARADVRGQRDELRDLNRLRQHFSAVKAISLELPSLRGRMDAMSLQRQRVLMTELHQLAREEFAMAQRELAEDRRALAEMKGEPRDVPSAYPSPAPYPR